jgi:hypothetical protein
MLSASTRLAALPAASRTPAMQEALHRSQANDAYWHGLFGGLYLPHLRRAIWNNLLALEAALPPGPPRELADLDNDGIAELALRSGSLQAFVPEDGHAALVELSSLPLAHNLGDTLRRYPEAYHAKLGLQQSAQAAHDGIASAHDRVAFRHEILPGDADPDTRPRAMFQERVIAADGSATAVESYVADPGTSRYVAEGEGWRLVKRYQLDGDTLSVEFTLEGRKPPAALETELNLAMPSCDGFGGRYQLPGGEVPSGFGTPLARESLAALRLEDSELKGAVDIAVSPSLTFDCAPHLTVSQSEAGFEKIMQAVCIRLRWNQPKGRMTVRLTLSAAAPQP